MRVTRASRFILCLAIGVAACGKDSPSAPGGSTGLAAPSPSSPAEASQLSTLRPTLVVNNATSGEAGAKVYEFQISDKIDFSTAGSASGGAFAAFISATNVAEGAGGTTSYTPTLDLQPATRMYWRARVTQGTATSEWSPTRTFNSQIIGYSRAGELFDPLTAGATVGAAVGSTTFIAGKGIRINDQNSYVRYQLAQTISSGEFSVEVEGLYPNGPGEKGKIFSMMDGSAHLLASKYNLSTQYRGINGNPPNAISFKAVFGDEDFKLEPDFAQRLAAVVSLDPSRTYFWKATWSNEFRLVVQDGRNGPTLYDLGVSSRGSTYAPSPHVAFLGASNAVFGEEAGSWPGVTYRNLWIGTGTRPATLGNAVN